MIDYDILFSSTIRIECTFSDDIGNSKSGTGTGFVVEIDNGFVIVTNKHMVNYQYIDDASALKLTEMSIWCRKSNASSIENPSEKFKVGLPNIEIIQHPTADVVLIIGVQLWSEGYPPFLQPMKKDSLATQEFFSTQISISDPCVFIGYPGNKNPWWDTSLGLPIARQAYLASLPQKDFVNENINSSHARLINGLSFSGSSGSPILNLGYQFKTKNGYVNFGEATIMPKIIGIMAGHWWHTNRETPEMLRHSGLSYFVSSLAILELLE